MIPFYISLGANMGDRVAYLKQAISELKKLPDTEIESISPIYETNPVGYTDQPVFLNMAIGGKTGLPADILLKRILEIELQLGRKREIRWGPRVIDIDILVYGTERIKQPDLEIPHPRMLERAFVLVPLADIAAHQLIPLEQDQWTTPIQLLENVMDKSGVREWNRIDWGTELELSES